jgi:hypothetical protein
MASLAYTYLFYPVTTITIGTGTLLAFGMYLGLGEESQMTWCHPYSESPRGKTSWLVRASIKDFWIPQIMKNYGITTNNIAEFVDLWTKVQEVQLIEATRWHRLIWPNSKA